MNNRALLSGFLGLVCVATLWCIWSQRSEVLALRAEQQALKAQLAAKADDAPAPAGTDSLAARRETAEPAVQPTPELLRLRNEVTRLGGRRQELLGARSQNEQLRAQLASRGTNAAAGPRLPPGYILKRNAQLVGYNTPEDTLQSFLWALQNRDLTNVLRSFSPKGAEAALGDLKSGNRTSEDLFRDAARLPGMGIVGRTVHQEDGRVELEVEILPGAPTEHIRLKQTNNEWQIDGPF